MAERVAERSRRRRRRALGLAGGAAVVAVVLGAADLALTYVLHAPRMAALARENPARTSYMERAERSGHPVRSWTWTPLDSIPPVVACAVILSEDSEFYNIGTLNYEIQREMLRRVLGGDFSRGGSGFAQQLARNLYLGPQRTPRRKAREYLLAWQLTHALSKDRQLELYLNVVEWGDGVWGVHAGSRHYFGVPPAELLPSEAIVLALLLPAPRVGLRYALAERSVRKTPGLARGLMRAMLMGDPDAGAVIDRLELWRRGIEAGRPHRDVTASIDSVMGRESGPYPLLRPEGRPLGELCDGRRRAS